MLYIALRGGAHATFTQGGASLSHLHTGLRSGASITLRRQGEMLYGFNTPKVVNCLLAQAAQAHMRTSALFQQQLRARALSNQNHLSRLSVCSNVLPSDPVTISLRPHSCSRIESAITLPPFSLYVDLSTHPVLDYLFRVFCSFFARLSRLLVETFCTRLRALLGT